VAIMSNFRATTREVTAKYYATELYATEREKIEIAIKTQLFTSVGKYGIIIDAILLKDIVLPDQITKAIQNKVQAEQEAFQMDFVIMKQKKEAERLIIEAEGIRTFQEIINQSMTKSALQFQYIEMMKGLVTSGNSKVIITNGNMQMMMDPNDDIVK
jgi:prohibitin 1